jgi:hypothetical protein
LVDTSGVSGADDIQSESDAARLLEIDVDADDGEIDSAFRDASLETHPDLGGDAEIFKAVKKAEDILQGRVDPEGGTAQDQQQKGGRGSDGAATQDPGGGRGGDFGGFAGSRQRQQEGPDPDVVFDAVFNLLETQTTEERLKDKYGPLADMESVAEVLTGLIIAGGLDLGDVRKMLDEGFSFGSSMGEATGGLFGGPATDAGIFGGGGGLGSSDPADYMSYGASRSDDDDDDDG